MPLLKNIKDKIVESKNEAEKIEKIIEEAGAGIKREKGIEKTFERGAGIEKKAERMEFRESVGSAEMAGFSITPAVQQALKEREQKIEKILEENIAEIFLAMPPNKQLEFKLAGEKTAREINKLLTPAKIKLKKIIDLIKKWLALLPGINRFFLEQESKIKADKILEIKREHE